MAATLTAPPRPTWRDELTPDSRASRRRWTVAYAALLVVAAVFYGTGDTDPDAGSFLLPVALLLVFGMLRRSTRRLAALDHPDLNERDVAARERAFRLAYPLLLAVLAALAVVLVLALPDTTRTVVQADTRVDTQAWYLTGDALLGLVVLVALWAVYLPTAVLAWIEPDGLGADPDDPRARRAEAGRDALLAGGLLAGLAAGVAADSPLLAVLPVLAVLALLGARARRRA